MFDTTRTFDGWQPVWSHAKPARKKGVIASPPETPHDWQEAKAPSVQIPPVKEDDHAPIRRRVADQRLWGAMTAAEQKAAVRIAAAYRALGRGLGFGSADPARFLEGRGRNGSPGDIGAALFDDYMDWAARCGKEKVSHSLAIDILVFGFSCRAVDRDRRQKSGMARRNLFAALAVYTKMKGWK